MFYPLALTSKDLEGQVVIYPFETPFISSPGPFHRVKGLVRIHVNPSHSTAVRIGVLVTIPRV